LTNIGLVSDALWTDFDNDQWIDLILVGEWMPITFFRNVNGTFVNITNETGIQDRKGWWNSIVGGDFDNDGDIDYVAGNHGHNSILRATSAMPLISYSSDFDNNGRYDAILINYMLSNTGEYSPFPIHLRTDINKQLESMSKKFGTYKAYSSARMETMFSKEELSGALRLNATEFSSSFIENEGDGTFQISPLPDIAQIGPMYGMLPGDFDDDQFLDLLVVGNSHDYNAFWGPYDAHNGLLLKGTGDGRFLVKKYPESGFFVPGDAKSMVHISLSTGENLVIVGQNQEELTITKNLSEISEKSLKHDDIWGTLRFEDNSIRKLEFYYGSTYLSQNPRTLYYTLKATEIRTYSIDGTSTQ
jgi:hypothetical protein